MPRLPRHLLTPLLLLALACLLQGMLLSCKATVTIDSKPVTNQALITAAESVHVAELAAVTITNALTSAYVAGQINRQVLEDYQASIAPKVKASLALAKVALQTWQSAPGQEAETTAVQALAAVAVNLQSLQGFYRDHQMIPAGGAQ